MNPERLLALFKRISEAPDAIPRLRRFILDLAVRGKLVEQDPEDEPAEELLQRLKLAKTLAHELEGLRKRQPVNSVSRGDLWFDMPADWALPYFDDLFIIVSGVTKGQKIPPSDAVEVPYLRVANVQRGSLDLSQIKTISVRAADVERYRLENQDILMTEGGDWDKLGRAAIWADQIPGCIHQNHVFRLRVPTDELIPEWVVLYANSDPGRKYFEDCSKQTTNLASINLTQLRSCPLPLPPLAEQHRIVAKVDELMALCDQLEVASTQREQCRVRLVAASLQRLNKPSEEPESFRSDARFALQVLPSLTSTTAQIKQLRQTILNLAVRGKLVEQDPEDEPAEEQLERIIEAKILHGRKSKTTKKNQTDTSGEADDIQPPNGWASAPLADLVTVLNGRAYKQSELLDAGTPVLRVGNLFTSNKWYYSDLELENDKYCDDGDLIFAWSASFGPFVWNGGRVIYHYHIWKLPLHSPSDLSRDYLYLYLLNKTAEIKATGHGISMVHMTKEKMERLEVPLPPLAEQHRIVSKVNELMALCDQLEQELSQAEQSRRGLLEAVLQEALADSQADLALEGRA